MGLFAFVTFASPILSAYYCGLNRLSALWPLAFLFSTFILHPTPQKRVPKLYLPKSKSVRDVAVFFSDILAGVWPRAVLYLQKQLRKSILTQLHNVPNAELISVAFKEGTPNFTSFRIAESEYDNELIVDVAVEFRGMVHVNLFFKLLRSMNVRVLVSYFSGTLRCVFGEAIARPPFFGVVNVFFLETPALSMDYEIEIGYLAAKQFPVVYNFVKDLFFKKLGSRSWYFPLLRPLRPLLLDKLQVTDKNFGVFVIQCEKIIPENTVGVHFNGKFTLAGNTFGMDDIGKGDSDRKLCFIVAYTELNEKIFGDIELHIQMKMYGEDNNVRKVYKSSVWLGNLITRDADCVMKRIQVILKPNDGYKTHLCVLYEPVASYVKLLQTAQIGNIPMRNFPWRSIESACNVMRRVFDSESRNITGANIIGVLFIDIREISLCRRGDGACRTVSASKCRVMYRNITYNVKIESSHQSDEELRYFCFRNEVAFVIESVDAFPIEFSVIDADGTNLGNAALNVWGILKNGLCYRDGIEILINSDLQEKLQVERGVLKLDARFFPTKFLCDVGSRFLFYCREECLFSSVPALSNLGQDVIRHLKNDNSNFLIKDYSEIVQNTIERFFEANI